MDSLSNVHVKLLAFDFLSLTPISPPDSFSRDGTHLSRAETLGIITSRYLKPGKFLKFAVDDGTGCVPCFLWLNQLSSTYFSRRNPLDVRLIARMALNFSSLAQIGVVVARVQGKITNYRGGIQLTVSEVVVERDPNAEILHWLQCVRLARKCYDKLPHCSSTVDCVLSMIAIALLNIFINRILYYICIHDEDFTDFLRVY